MTAPVVAVDAMGGDHAPGEIVAGVDIAVTEHGIDVVMVGRPDAFEPPAGVSVVGASEVIEMADDAARSVRTKKDSSLVRAAELVRDGHAGAMVSAGNTGAAVAAALLRMGRLKGVSRPAVASTLPVPGRTPKILLDSGAMSDCQPAWLQQFARMGSAFSRVRYGLAEPTVGLMSIGEEASKGNELTRATHELLAADSTINFIGNIEGRDVLPGDVDVIVADGFTGNVILKCLEGTVGYLVDLIVGVLGAPEAGDAGAQALGMLAPLAEEMNADAVGGAMLLGVDGVCIISHGSSSAVAVSNAIREGRDMVEADLVGELARAVSA